MVISDGGIYEKLYGQLNGLPRLQNLLCEAKTLDLIEIATGLVGLNIESGRADLGLGASIVGMVSDVCHLSELDRHRPYVWREVPRQLAVHIAIESDCDGAIGR